MVGGRGVVRVTLLSLLIIYISTLLLIGTRGFWITDNENKFLQIQTILDSGGTEFGIAWPGSAIDPAFSANPLPAPFTHRVDERLISQYPPLFALVSAPLYHYLGFTGLYLLPLLFAFLALVAISRLAEAMAFTPRGLLLSLLLAGLGTPLWFYSVLFWEHTIALAASLWALLFLLRSIEGGGWKPLLIGSFLAGLSIYARDDHILFCAAFLFFLFLYRERRKIASLSAALGVMILTVIPLGLFQWATIGSPFGYHVQANVANSSPHLAARFSVIYNLFLSLSPSVTLSLLLGVPLLLLFILQPRLGERAYRRLFPVGILFTLAVTGLLLYHWFTTTTPIADLMVSNGLFSAFPAAILAFFVLSSSGQGVSRKVGAFTLLYALLYAIAAPFASSWGIHWGCRFLLLLYPLFALLAARNLDTWLAHIKKGRGFAVGLVLLGCVILQLFSLDLVARKKHFSARLNAAVAARPERAVITDIPWLPPALFSIFDDRPIFLVRSFGKMREIERRLRDHGYRTVLFVTHRGRKKIPPGGEGIDDFRLNYFSLFLAPIEIQRAEGE